MPVAISLAELRRWLCLTPIARPRKGLEQALQWSAWRWLHQCIAQFYFYTISIPLGFREGMANPPRPGFRGRLILQAGPS